MTKGQKNGEWKWKLKKKNKIVILSKGIDMGHFVP